MGLFIKGEILWVTVTTLNHAIELVGDPLKENIMMGQATLFRANKTQFPESIDIP
jgi:hypothetical protein